MKFSKRLVTSAFLSTGLLLLAANVRSEAMLELFQLNWNQVTAKIPELAEAGYDSLWLPNPAKGNSGTFSIGYDQFDPFDLGDKNQQGTVATHYGTKADLLQMVQTAHRFGIRIYFDNVMNHRSSTVPGFPNSGTPTNYYPGLIPPDFHVQTVTGGYQNWASISDFCNQFQVQNQPLLGLIDLANEPGSINDNFGSSLGSTITKPIWIRHPNNPEYYFNTGGHSLGGPWYPFNNTNSGAATADDVSSYLIRAVMYTLYTTKCDGFRLDAVKHVPSGFFGANTGANAFSDDPSFAGYTGGIQAIYDYTHGYGSNVTANGYAETDGNRNSLFNLDATRNDAMIFGEHVAPVPDFQQYLEVGMRLLNQPLYNQMNSVLSGNASFSGMDGRDYAPGPNFCNNTSYPAYSAAQSVMFPQTQDGGSCCPVHQEMQDAYYFMHEGLPMIYSDGFNHNTGNGTPIVSYANFLGEFGDNRMPDICYLHKQLARGGTSSRWSDQNIVAFERYDYRESTNMQDETVVLFAMNDKSNPGDITFDDGVSRTSDGYYGTKPVSNSKSVGLVVGFPPGSVLVQLASTATAADRAYPKLLVHGATQSMSAATSSANNADPTQRLIYVGGQTLAPNGGAIELTIPSGEGSEAIGGWVMYGYQWPEPSRANPSTNAIIFRQQGVEVPHINITRTDGPNGDANYNPLFPFKMRGAVDQFGNVLVGTNSGSLSYTIDIPVVTNGAMDIIARSDASSANALIKLDGGTDLNSQMGLGPTNGGVGPTGSDLRDNRPGYATDVYLGYEQTAFDFRNGPEKFGSHNIASNNIVSTGAETYYYTVGSNGLVYVPGAGYGAAITNQTAAWVFHDPTNTINAIGTNGTMMNPTNPAGGAPVDIWIKVGYQFQINTCYIYYTIGTGTNITNPEGGFGVGKGNTQVIQAHFFNHDSTQNNIDWWKGTIPGQGANTSVRYKVALFSGGIGTISDAEISGSKLYGLTEHSITNFNPTSAVVWLHNDLNTNNTVIGLQEGFHIMRAKTFLPRSGKSSVFNTFAQTFYYDAQLPTGIITSPTSDGSTISNATYTVVVRADSTTTGVLYNIADSNPNNDDGVTGQPNGNGLSNGVPSYVVATPVAPNGTLTAQYPNLPLEYHFNYVAVPNSGTATINVQLNKLTTSLFTNRFTTLTRTVNTAAPTNVLAISSPAADGQTLYLGSNSTYPIQACFSQSLDTNNLNLFSIFINGVLQPRRDAGFNPLYSISPAGASPCGPGLRTLSYTWSNAVPGTNVIQVTFSNAVVLNDTRTVNVVNPTFDITSVSPGGSGNLVVWDSISNLDYQVWATTNLQIPMAPISGVIPATGPSAFYFDSSPDPTNEFYRIELVPQ